MLKINIMFPKELLIELDKIAFLQKKRRSRVLREAAEAYIAECKRSIEETKRRRDIEEAITICERLRKKQDVGMEWLNCADGETLNEGLCDRHISGSQMVLRKRRRRA